MENADIMNNLVDAFTQFRSNPEEKIEIWSMVTVPPFGEDGLPCAFKLDVDKVWQDHKDSGLLLPPVDPTITGAKTLIMIHPAALVCTFPQSYALYDSGLASNAQNILFIGGFPVFTDEYRREYWEQKRQRGTAV